MDGMPIGLADTPLCRAIAQASIHAAIPREAEAIEKLRICLLDFLTCAL